MLVEGQLNITGYKYLSQEMPPTVSCDLFISQPAVVFMNNTRDRLWIHCFWSHKRESRV